MPWINTADRNTLHLDVHNTLSVYNGLDCCVTHEIHDKLIENLSSDTKRIYEYTSLLQAPAMDMMIRGVKINKSEKHQVLQQFKAMKLHYETYLNRLGHAIWDQDINPESPKQLILLFYFVMQIPEIKTRKGREYKVSADREALEKIRQNYAFATPIVNLILAIRDCNSMIEVLERGIDADGRMRCSYNIAGTITGRWSSSTNIFGLGGNLQNVTDSLRIIFIADKGKKIAYLDLEQAESRAVGLICWMLTGVRTYLDACYAGDLHTLVCKLVWPELPWPNDPKGDRAVANTIFYRTYSYRDMAKRGGHGCLTGDHEVLTPDGWVPIYTKPPVILTWDTNGQSRFSSVQKWTDYLYNGTLHEFTGNSWSSIMTADHRIPYTNKPNKEMYHTNQAVNGPKGRMPLGEGYVGGKETVPARLIAAFMADGHQKSANRMEFHLHKQRKWNRLLQLATAYGFEYSEDKINNKISIIGNLPKIAGAFMFNWTKECLEDFLDEYKYWDGYIAETHVSLFSANLEHLTWIQTFGRILGIGGSIQKARKSGFGSKVYTLQQNNRKYARGNKMRWTKTEVSYISVYCPTVSSSFFYVRRNGKIFVTGNSNYGGEARAIATHLKIETKVAEAFQERYFKAFPEIKEWHRWTAATLRGSWSLTTPYGRVRRFYGRLDEKKTVNEGIAFCPQSLVADMLNQGMYQIFLMKYAPEQCSPHFRDKVFETMEVIKQKYIPVELLMQVHDAVVQQYPTELEHLIMPLCIKALETPLPGYEFFIPAEGAVGWNWGKCSKKPDGRIINPLGLVTWKPDPWRDSRNETMLNTNLE